MRYLVCTPRGQDCSVIRVMGEHDTLDQPFEVWALNSGARVLFIEHALGRLLERHRISGDFKRGALYGLAYDEVVSILESKMGEHDRHRYERLMREHDAMKEDFQRRVRESKYPRWAAASAIGWGLTRLTVTFMVKTLSLIVFLIVFPIIIGIIRGLSSNR